MCIKGTTTAGDLRSKAIHRVRKKMEERVIYRCLYSSCSVETVVLLVGLKCTNSKISQILEQILVNSNCLTKWSNPKKSSDKGAFGNNNLRINSIQPS